MSLEENARRYVLSRIDPRKTTPAAVVAALAAAGVTVTHRWAADWIARHKRGGNQ